MAIRIKGKIWKTGNGYVITIPKTVVESGNFALGQNVVAELQAQEATNARGRISTRSWETSRLIGHALRPEAET